tara:strand:- start:4639 stop:5289 length:651 start_codon:yes stop_codon:yes gene_type:complete
MVKEVTLSIPTSYGDISLKKWLEFQKELKNYEGDDEAITALMFFHLCGLEPAYLKGLAVDDYANIKTQLELFLTNTDLPLQRIIKVDGVEYGFEPNLSQMTYGAYADITSFKELTIDDNWAKIMSILYRPIVHKKGEMYSIQSYKGTMDADKFLEVGMDVHFGALFFFVNLLMDLLKGILNSTMQMELPHNIKSILQRSGQLIPHSLNSPAEILQK